MLRAARKFLLWSVLSLLPAVLNGTEVKNPAEFPSVARVMSWNERGGSLGSATCVYSSDMTGNSYLLTATHVIEGAIHRPRVTFPDGSSYFAEIVYSPEGSDVTVLRIAGRREHWTPISDELPDTGDEVMFAGYGAMSTHNWNRDHFLGYTGPVIGRYYSARTGVQNRISCWTPKISQGDSGGAVFWRGKHVGVISARIVALGHGIFCETKTIGIDMTWIRKLDLQGRPVVEEKEAKKQAPAKKKAPSQRPRSQWGRWRR